MSLRDYIPTFIIALILVYGAVLFLTNQCTGGPERPHQCSVVNDGRGNETCDRVCGEGFVVTEEYCTHCDDCMMCYYGCDMIESDY